MRRDAATTVAPAVLTATARTPCSPYARELFASPLLSFGRFDLATGDPHFEDAGPIGGEHHLVFPDSCVVISQSGRRPFLADPNVVVQYNAGQAYRRRPASPEGDHCWWIRFAPQLCAQLAGRLPCTPDPERPFDRSHQPLPAASRLAVWTVARELRRGEDRALGVEEALLRLVGAALVRGVATCEPALGAAQRRLCEEAKAILAFNLERRLSLVEIASRLEVSVFHLCRIFRRATGMTLHGYRQQLRLRHGLCRLEAARGELAGLALDLGFAHHSHFTAAFGRCFGVTPRQAIATSAAELWRASS